MKKKKTEEDGIDTNAWMVTFSDLLSLLMTFFVMLLSMASLDNQKLKETIGAFRAYLGVMEFGNVIKIKWVDDDSAEVVETFKFLDPDLEEGGLTVAVEQLIEKEGWGKSIELRSDADRLVLIFHENIMFELGGSVLLPESDEVIRGIVELLQRVSYYVRVEGHTDNRPIDTSTYPSNWELSVARAVSVAVSMEKHGLPPERLAVVGYGDSRPLSSNDTVENRLRNRRVELTMMFKSD